MGSWRFTTIICVATLALAPLGARAQQPKLAIEPGLLARLQTLAAGLHSEIVLCLTGAADESTATVTGFMMPDPDVSDADRASFGPCPRPPGSIAIWHNHPLERHTATVSKAGGDYALPPGPARPHGDPNLRPVDLCALSRTDMHTLAREAAPFAVVSVDRETWCWWSLEQVRRLVAKDAPRGDAVHGQVAFSRPSYQPR